MVEAVSVPQFLVGGEVAQKHEGGITCWSTILEVLDDRPAYILQQRQAYPLRRLRLNELDVVGGPLEVLQFQVPYIARTQTQPSDKEHDRVVSLPARTTSVDGAKQGEYILL